MIEYVLDGERFHTLEEFYIEIGRVLLDGQPWGENLEAFTELLRGDSGLLPPQFLLRWRHAALSRERLGYTETVRQLTFQLRDCHPTALIKTAWALRSALRGQGMTIFDRLVELLQAQSNIELLLEEEEYFLPT